MASGIRMVQNNISPSLRRIQNDLEKLPGQAYKVFVENTPVRNGNARRKTKLKGKNIVADYPYAKRLDEGYSSQRPDGMTKPTEQFVQKQTDKIMRK
jgi:hypothetical protein